MRQREIGTESNVESAKGESFETDKGSQKVSQKVPTNKGPELYIDLTKHHLTDVNKPHDVKSSLDIALDNYMRGQGPRLYIALANKKNTPSNSERKN